MTATPPLAPDPASVVREALAGLASPGSLGRDALLDAVTVLGEVQAVLDAVKLRVAGELENRSVVLGPENPVTRAGHVNAAACWRSGGESPSARRDGTAAWER